MTELKDLFLPYEESLAMRELGFEENVICVYNAYEYLKGVIIGSMDADYIKKDKWDNRLPAPLYQQTLDFFRKKGYHIDIYSDNHQDILNADNWYWLFSKGVNTSCTDSFGSYEEARLDCIRALIKTELNNKS